MDARGKSTHTHKGAQENVTSRCILLSVTHHTDRDHPTPPLGGLRNDLQDIDSVCHCPIGIYSNLHQRCGYSDSPFTKVYATESMAPLPPPMSKYTPSPVCVGMRGSQCCHLTFSSSFATSPRGLWMWRWIVPAPPAAIAKPCCTPYYGLHHAPQLCVLLHNGATDTHPALSGKPPAGFHCVSLRKPKYLTAWGHLSQGRHSIGGGDHGLWALEHMLLCYSGLPWLQGGGHRATPGSIHTESKTS